MVPASRKRINATFADRFPRRGVQHYYLPVAVFVFALSSVLSASAGREYSIGD
jgi:hypothetical protein